MVLSLVCTLLQLFVLAIIGRIIFSWFPISPGSPLSSVYSVLYTITEPILGPLRRVIPPLGMFDLSAIIALVAIQLISASICSGASGLF